MLKPIHTLLALTLLSCNVNAYYVVRHAEKEQGTTMTASTTKTTDVPLSAKGEERAIALQKKLAKKHIQHIYSTNTLRTIATAKPLSESSGVQTQFYNTIDTAFIARLKSIQQNVLIVGHSNTVDDVVNRLVGEKKLTDLPDPQYGDLFVVKQKGKRYVLKAVERFGD